MPDWAISFCTHDRCVSKMFVSLRRADKGQRGQSWRELFRDFYADLGRYIDHYSTLRKAWDDLKSYLGQKCPRMIASLKGAFSLPLALFTLLSFKKKVYETRNDHNKQDEKHMNTIPLNITLTSRSMSIEGAKEEELDAIEAQIGCKLPNDYRCSYRIHNGQKLVVPGWDMAYWGNSKNNDFHAVECIHAQIIKHVVYYQFKTMLLCDPKPNDPTSKKVKSFSSLEKIWLVLKNAENWKSCDWQSERRKGSHEEKPNLAHSKSLMMFCVSLQADGQHGLVQSLSLRRPVGHWDRSRGIPAEEGHEALSPPHLLLSHRTESVHGFRKHRGTHAQRDLLPLSG